VIVSVDEKVGSGLPDDGLNAPDSTPDAIISAGPERLKATSCAEPATMFTVTVYVALPPGDTVRSVGEIDNPKSNWVVGGCPAVTIRATDA
jgi:hypothetical protein